MGGVIYQRDRRYWHLGKCRPDDSRLLPGYYGCRCRRFRRHFVAGQYGRPIRMVDHIGRKNIYLVYLGVGIILYLLIAFFGGSSMVLFIIAAIFILSFYGGGFSTVPAYLKDMFGVFQVGAIHGRLLTAWSAAGIAGPLIVNSVVESQAKAGHEGP